MTDSIQSSRLVTIGLLGATAVGLGALGAHALKMQVEAGHMTPEQLNGFDTAARYQIYHTLAMLLVALPVLSGNSKYFTYAYRFFFAGILMFSGSLYLLCTRNLTGLESLKILGPVTPIGGLSFMAGWLCLVIAALKKS